MKVNSKIKTNIFVMIDSKSRNVISFARLYSKENTYLPFEGLVGANNLILLLLSHRLLYRPLSESVES